MEWLAMSQIIIGVDSIMDIDILPEAKKATFRDRPEIYDDYLVTNLADMPKKHKIKLEEEHFNCLTTVAALGFDDIPPIAFLRALDFIETPGWIAINIKEDFLHEDDTSGFCRLIRQMNREKLMQIQCYRRYRHRISITGKPLYYVAMIAKKLKAVPNTLLTKQGSLMVHLPKSWSMKRIQGVKDSSEMLKNYKELKVWQKPYQLCLEIYKITAKLNT